MNKKIFSKPLTTDEYLDLPRWAVLELTDENAAWYRDKLDQAKKAFGVAIDLFSVDFSLPFTYQPHFAVSLGDLDNMEEEVYVDDINLPYELYDTRLDYMNLTIHEGSYLVIHGSIKHTGSEFWVEIPALLFL